jgi:hypothetical protein
LSNPVAPDFGEFDLNAKPGEEPGPPAGPLAGTGADGDDGDAPRTGLRPARAIGGTLNALVRATALYRKRLDRWAIASEGESSETQREIASRAAKNWREANPNVLEFEPTRLKVGDETALQADNEYAQWILYAFMAGVRRVEPRRAMGVADVIGLVEALVALKPTVESIERFRDWLDAGGAEGFDVRIHTSFTEVFEEVDLEEEREFSSAFAMARFEAPSSGDAVYVAARDLDMVAMRREFEMPIEMYASDSMGLVAGGLSAEELAAIAGRCDDAKLWVMAELEAILSLEGLRATILPEQLARRIVIQLSEEADEQLLLLLTRLGEGTDPFLQQVSQALATDDVGEVIARQLRIDSDEQIESLARFFAKSPPGLARVVVGGLLDRSLTDPAARYAVFLLMKQCTPARFCEWVDAGGLDEETAAVLGAAFGHGREAAGAIMNLLVKGTLAVDLALLKALPEELLPRLNRAFPYLWDRAKTADHEAIADLMIKGSSSINLKFLGEKLLDGSADRWHGRILYALCAALVKNGLGREYVMELAQRRTAREKQRLIALDCLRFDRRLLKEVCRWRPARLVESGAIKDRIRELTREMRK